MWLGNGLSYAQPSAKGRGSAAVKSRIAPLASSNVISVTRFAFGSVRDESPSGPALYVGGWMLPVT